MTVIMVKIQHRKASTYQIYFTSEARKIYPFKRFKLNVRNLTIKEPSEFERSIKIEKEGAASMGLPIDISGTYSIEEDDGVYYLTLKK